MFFPLPFEMISDRLFSCYFGSRNVIMDIFSSRQYLQFFDWLLYADVLLLNFPWYFSGVLFCFFFLFLISVIYLESFLAFPYLRFLSKNLCTLFLCFKRYLVTLMYIFLRYLLLLQWPCISFCKQLSFKWHSFFTLQLQSGSVCAMAC